MCACKIPPIPECRDKKKKQHFEIQCPASMFVTFVCQLFSSLIIINYYYFFVCAKIRTHPHAKTLNLSYFGIHFSLVC